MPIQIFLRLWDKNKKLIYARSSAKRQLLYDRLRTLPFLKGYIKVLYGNKHFNDANFNTLLDAKWFLSTFTEGNLVKFLQSNI